jgi:putative SOS response-associated peptidase YedK
MVGGSRSRALWSSWKDRKTGNSLLSCTMLITEPNKFVAEVHDRMPVIFEAKDFAQARRREGCHCADEARARGRAAEWPVSKRVNSSGTPNDDPSLIERIAKASRHA